MNLLSTNTRNAIKDIFTFCLLTVFFFGSVSGQLSGEFKIQANETGLKDLKNVIASMETEGISGPVIISLEAGVFPEALIIHTILGVSEENSIQIIGDENNGTIIKSSTNYTLLLENTSFVHISNMNFEFEGDYGTAMKVSGNISNLTFDNCSVNSVSPTVSLVSMEGNFQGINFEGNVFEGGNSGIEFSSGVSTGIKIEDNQFVNQSRSGIKLTSVDNVTINGNDIKSSAPYFDFTGIDVVIGTGNLKISNNKVVSMYGTGVSLFAISSDDGEGATLFNNVLSIFGAPNSTQLLKGMSIQNCDLSKVWFNSIYVGENTNSSSLALSIDGDLSGTEILNNMIENAGAGTGISFQEVPSESFIMDYNNVYTPNTIAVNCNTDVFFTMNIWKNKFGMDMNSTSMNPGFNSFETLTFSNPSILNTGMVIEEVKRDINGEQRDVQSPTIGAFENVSFGDVTGMETVSSEIQVNVYPNPVVDYVTVSTPMTSNFETYTIVNVEGKVLFSDQLDMNSTTIDLSNVTSGTYFLTVNGNNESITERIIVRK